MQKDYSLAIINGGINDVWSSNCREFNVACQEVVEEVASSASSLLTSIRAQGVKHILYMGCHKVNPSEIHPKVIDYLADSLKNTCDAHPECNYMDARSLDVPLSMDGLHPTPQGYQVLSSMIWDTIRQKSFVEKEEDK